MPYFPRIYIYVNNPHKGHCYDVIINTVPKMAGIKKFSYPASCMHLNTTQFTTTQFSPWINFHPRIPYTIRTINTNHLSIEKNKVTLLLHNCTSFLSSSNDWLPTSGRSSLFYSQRNDFPLVNNNVEMTIFYTKKLCNKQKCVFTNKSPIHFNASLLDPIQSSQE